MDIAYYISDLLGQQGELTVPNLGYFVQIRMPAYYDSQAKKFFPPHFSVQFDPQTIDEDETLARHITGVKNISLASAKYFVEKYIANLKSQAVIEDVPFANLGSFTSDGLKLSFNSTSKMDDPAFFASPPLEAYKLNDRSARRPAEPRPVQNTPPPVAPGTPEPEVITPAPAVQQPVAIVEAPVEEEYYEDEPRRISAWIWILIALTLIVIAAGALYKFRPDLVNKYLPVFKKDTTVVKPAVAAIKKDSLPAAKPDTLAAQTAVKKDSVKIDTPKATANKAVDKKITEKKQEPVIEKKTEVVKPAPKKAEPVIPTPKKQEPAVTTQPPVNTPAATTTVPGSDITKGTWVIYAGAWPNRKPAESRITDLKSRGFLDARLLTEKVSKAGNYKVIIGNGFQTRKEADDRTKELISTGKIKATEMFVDKVR